MRNPLPKDFGNLRLPEDLIVRTRELRYEGEATIMCPHVGFSQSFPNAGGHPLSRHSTPMEGCAAQRLARCRDIGCPWCPLVGARAFQASFRERLGIELGGRGN